MPYTFLLYWPFLPVISVKSKWDKVLKLQKQPMLENSSNPMLIWNVPPDPPTIASNSAGIGLKRATPV
ncbi:hypothetical protein RRG08_036506 [Elysia crispata]|uniref:Uncharacterized protein n=1 Tax=Elysia crispata TaxID=231223 RepID=A0AAE0ZLY2_9GAST|nr:hypothetical protein RRG08_036506 [Elysia crispata]